MERGKKHAEIDHLFRSLRNNPMQGRGEVGGLIFASWKNISDSSKALKMHHCQAHIVNDMLRAYAPFAY